LDQYVTLVTEIRGYCTRNEIAAREEEDTVEEGPTTGTPGRGRMTISTSRKISLTCETLLRSTALPPQVVIPDSGLLAEPRRGSSGRLRSPAPSPVPSPVSSPVPSPSRTRFQVSTYP
jgi:protein phosphatase 1 regulatory subunit 37